MKEKFRLEYIYPTGSSMMFINDEWQVVLVTIQRCEERILNTNLTDESVIRRLEKHSLYSRSHYFRVKMKSRRIYPTQSRYRRKFFFFLYLQFKFLEAAFLISDARSAFFAYYTIRFFSVSSPHRFRGNSSWERCLPPPSPRTPLSFSSSAVDPSRVLRARLCLIS